MASTLNHALAHMLSEMSDMYRFKGGDDRFRALAYAKASRVIDGLKDDIKVYIRKGALEDIPGVGESISEKIQEFVSTGRIRKYDELKRSVPFELLEMMSISGFGPQSLKQIHDELKISTREELVAAIHDGRINSLKGFGPRKVSNMLRGLKLYKASEERILYADAKSIAARIVDKLSQLKEVLHIEVAGSIRRGLETIGDVDIVVAARMRDRKKIIQQFTLVENRKEVLAKGDTKASILVRDFNRQVDLRVVGLHEWGAALLYFTGSKEHNVFLRGMAKDRGMKLNEYGLFDLKTDKRIAGSTEQEIYKSLGLSFIPPEMREMHGEIELAAQGNLPDLITSGDIKGDMQMHSTWSDGAMDIAQLADFVMTQFQYEYIVLTDHSRSSRIAHGMDEGGFREQAKAIDRINHKLKRDFIRKGVEVDILADGSLDLSDAVLKEMDWVCASVHSGFGHDNTERLIKACRHPLVNCIGHPSGRLIGKREAYEVDWKRVFDIAAKTGTAMEINAQPDRMDLNDQLARQAREAGVMLTISTDSHAENNFLFMEMGVMVARRAWCTSADILNTKPWSAIQKQVQRKRAKS